MKQLLIDAKEEITSLRHRNEILSAKVETMELLGGFLYAQLPSRNVGMSEDVAWKLMLEIQRMEIAEKDKKS